MPDVTGIPLIGEIILAVFASAVGLARWYIKDRKKSRAETVVAERTVHAQVATQDVGALQATLVYIEKAFDVERESKDREIQRMHQESEHLREELRSLRVENNQLRVSLARLEAKVNRAIDTGTSPGMPVLPRPNPRDKDR